MSSTDHRDSRSIERELDATRHRLDSDLDLLLRRASPGDMAERAVSFMKQGDGAQFGRNLAGQVRDKPLAVALVGAGLAWLMAGPKGSTEGASRAGSRLGDSASGARDRAGDVASGIGQRLSNAAGAVGGGMHASGSGARDAGQSAWVAMQENPVLAAAIGITAGAALAALLPPTQMEDEHLGPAIDKASEQLREQAKPAMERMQEVAGRTADAAMKGARQEVEGQRAGGDGQRGEQDSNGRVRVDPPGSPTRHVDHPPTVS